MILIVTNKEDYTADFLIVELRKRGASYIRFNTEDFPLQAQITWHLHGKSLDGYFTIAGVRVHFESIQSVWFRRPLPPKPHTEFINHTAFEFAQIESQAALDGAFSCLDCFWMSQPEKLRRAEQKLYQLKMAATAGFQLGPTLLTNVPEAARSFWHSCQGQVVYKTLRQERILRDGNVCLIYTNPVRQDDLPKLDTISVTPSLFQQYIPKLVEIRATVIGSMVFAIEIHSQDYPESQHDWRRGDIALLRHAAHKLPDELAVKCVDLVKLLGLTFGAIDLILTPGGDYFFLEINPNGQWAWIQQLCPEISLRESIADILIGGQIT